MRAGAIVGPLVIGDENSKVLARIRQRLTSTFALCALLIFAIGPGLSLHALGDLAHASTYHDVDTDEFDHTHFHEDEDGGACAFEHDHDQGHEAGVSVASLSSPQHTSAMDLTSDRVIYPPTDDMHPDLHPASGPDRPPRLLTSA